MLANLDTSLLEQFKGRVVQRIVQIEYDFPNTTVDDHFGAHQAGGEGRIERPFFDTGSVISSLSDGILFSMGTQTFI